MEPVQEPPIANEELSQTNKATRKSNTVVVYYSRSGITRAVAEYLAHRFEWLIVEIQELKPRSASRFNPWTYFVSGYESYTKHSSPIRAVDVDWDNIKLVIVGTPVWAGAMASPVRTFLSECLPKTAQYAMMYTCQFSTSHDKAQTNLCNEATHLMDGRAPLVVLGVSASEVHNGELSYDAKLKLEGMNIM